MVEQAPGEQSGLPETVPVAQAQRFDEPRFAGYLAAELGARLEEIRQMSGGQSNPTFLVITDKGEFVLRKQPPGNLLPSAHAIDREFRVMSALSATDLPVPRAILYCNDAQVIGTPFYLMERLKGRVFTSSLLPEVARDDRRRIYFGMAETLARLHLTDWQAVGLADFGRPDNYFLRQIKRWSGQWEKSKTRDNPSIDKLIEWLPRNLPPQTDATICHGDFRLNNIMYHPTKPRVIGVLDWELSTLGPALADLAHNCINYYLPQGIPNSLAGVDLEACGIPTEAEYLEHYYRVVGSRNEPRAFHRAFALFRLAVIVEGILARARKGTASSARAFEAGARGIQIADQGWQIAVGWGSARA